MKTHYRVFNEEERDSYEKINWKPYNYDITDAFVTNSLYLAKIWFKEELNSFEKRFFVIERVNKEGREVIYREGDFK